MDKTSSMENSAIVDLEAMDGDDSDYEVNFNDTKYDSQTQQSSEKQPGVMEDIKGEVTKNMTSYMFEAGRERAKKVFNIYGNIDILRPYFDVEPHEVRQRLLQSLIPQKPSADIKQKVHRELYGPLMIVFTLIALLLFQMKVSDHNVEEGTLMGSAFAVCFGYWFGIASLMWVLAYVCNTHITMLQILSLLGYAMFGHCIVLFLGTIFHTGHDHAMFYLLWAIFGGLSTVKMISVLISRTAGKTQKLILCGFIALTHLLFLLYLHFAYHKIVEDLSSVIDKQGILPKMDIAHSPPEKLNLENPQPGLPDDVGAFEVKRGIRSLPDAMNQQVKNLTLKYPAGAANSVHIPRDGEGSNSVLGQKGSDVKHQSPPLAKSAHLPRNIAGSNSVGKNVMLQKTTLEKSKGILIKNEAKVQQDNDVKLK